MRLAQGQQLENELAQRQWLVAGPASAGGNATLHPWLRRLLLRLLASPDTGKSLLAQQTTWTIAHEAARRATPPKTAAALHYDLALGRFDGPVDWLADRLAQVTKEISVDEWIDDLVLVTSAPHETVSDLSAFDWYIDLMSRCTNAAITREPIKEFLLQVVIARWIWADPLGDPTLELKTTLENAFQNLASKCPAGARRLTDIGNAHKEGARP